MVTLDHSPVHSDPEILGGTVVFRDTRVMAQSLIEYIDAGHSVDSFLAQFPSVHRDDALEFLKLVREDSHS